MPVKTGLLDHQVTPLADKVTPQILDQHANIDDYPGKNVESVETRDGKKEIGKIRRRFRSVRIRERIPTPPRAFAIARQRGDGAAGGAAQRAGRQPARSRPMSESIPQKIRRSARARTTVHWTTFSRRQG